MAAQWFVMIRGRREGPYPPERLQQMVDRGEVYPDDLVWCDGMADWIKARTVVKPSGYAPPVERPRPRYGDRDPDDYPDRGYRERPPDDYEPELRRPQGPPAQFPGRLVTPAFFFVCILLFFVPWVDVRCSGQTVASQSGLQLCLGTYSESWLMETERRNGGVVIPENEKISATPLVMVYGLLILGGFVFGLSLPVGITRLLLTALPAFVAFLMMMLQLGVGFPISEPVKKANEAERFRRDVFVPRPPPVFGPPPFPGDRRLEVSTTPWFWLAVILTLAPGAGLMIEHLGIFRRAPDRLPDADY